MRPKEFKASHKRKRSWQDDDVDDVTTPQRKRRCVLFETDTIIEEAPVSSRKQMSLEDYTVAIIVPLALELTPIRALLTEIHADLPTGRSFNSYTLGAIEHHNVVVAILPTIGNNDSSSVATQLTNDFPNIKFGLVVGIGGGVPDEDGNPDIRLGDVVVSEPAGPYGAVIQLDRGKKIGKDGFERTGHLNGPPPVLASAVKKLKAKNAQQGYSLADAVLGMLLKNSHMEDYRMPDPSTDYLFRHTYEHKGTRNCDGCDKQMLVPRPFRSQSSRIHYGLVGSSNAVIKSGTEREKLRAEFNILSVEMEAAGIMNVLPCLTIRGICDYSDSHKNKRWQPYAAAVAAAYTKELLLVIPPVQVDLGQNRLIEAKYPYLAGLSSERLDEAKVVLKALLQSLDFHRMDARLNNIEEAYSQTCRWIFQDDLFKLWIDRNKFRDNRGFFWIKGKPGSGKSTVMKTIVSWTKEHRSDEVAICYFFNARAHGELEKSTLGLYRSLVYQLLDRVKQLRGLFLEMFRSKYHVKSTAPINLSGVSIEPPTIDEWTETELKSFFASAVKRSSRPLSVFIDALDEGDESDIRRLVAFLETIASSVSEDDPRLRICLSSRHYPEIRIKRALSLVIEDHPGHRADIETYIEEKLDNELDIEIQGLRLAICEKSAMVFLWIVLVVPMLQQAYDKGRMDEMARCLEELPQDLEKLFEEILSNDAEDIDQCYALLHWVAYAQRPLDPSELYLAIHSVGKEPSIKHKILHSESALKRCLLDQSRGLVEMTNEEPERSSLSMILLHHYLSSTCLRYLHANILDLQVSSQSSATRYQVYESLGFLEYAATYIFDHAEIAIANGIQQTELLEKAVSLNFHQNWASAIDWCSYGHASYHEFGGKRDLLCWLVERRCTNLVQDLLSSTFAREAVRKSIKYAIIEAASRGNSGLLRILLEGSGDCDLASDDYTCALVSANDARYEQVVALLVEKGANVNANISPSRSGHLLMHALSKDSEESLEQVRVLIKYGADVNWIDDQHGTALHSAISSGSSSKVRLLLEGGASVHASGGKHGPVLLKALAAEKSSASSSIVLLLKSYGADFGVQGGRFNSALQAAAFGGDVENVRMVLATGADVNAKGGSYGDALHAAASAGHAEVIRLLLDSGADVDAVDSRHRTALFTAVSRGHEEVVKVLMSSGMDVNPQSDSYDNVLCRAIREADDKILNFILSHGNHLFSHGDDLGNAIQFAVHKGKEKVVRLLLKHEGYINFGAKLWSSALSAAADAAQYRIGFFLRQSGVKPWVFPGSDDDSSSGEEEEEMIRY